MMCWTYDWISAFHSKKLTLDVGEHRVRSILEEGHNQFANHVTMLLDRLVLGMLNRLQEIIIAFHTRGLHLFVLGIGIHACNATCNNNFLHQWTYLPAIKGA
jgi:hypothetical protein